MTLEATASIAWVNTVVQTACRLGVKEETLLKTAGLPLDALSWERWPIDYITRLWHAAEHCTKDPGFGLKTGAGVSPVNIDVLGIAMQSSATLRESFSLVQKYQRLISDGGRFQMLPGERETWVVYHPCQGQLAFSPYQIEAVLAAVVGFNTWISGSKICPIRVQFSQSQLSSYGDYQRVFNCPVEFEQAFSGLLISNDILDRPLPQADPVLAQIHEQYSSSRLTELENDSIVLDLRQWIKSRVGETLPRRTEAARMLGISERTLARRLDAQGFTFKEMLDEVRRELALVAVRESRKPLAEIAQSLGFAESSTFYRAFRRWTGLPPARWLKQQAEESNKGV
ncbi:AraC family transcriptional regulator [Pseudoteredinibacter isoporae]|nr:AraC family transcriptional regulator [Pseudoteredinibacter isoporae]NIB23903.1 AraC family transcriptional regulator [Pseudoteredinibacter isoporae]